MVPNSKARQKIIESLTENTNCLWKNIHSPLKARSAALEEWSWDTINSESDDYDVAWTGKSIFRGARKKNQML